MNVYAITYPLLPKRIHFKRARLFVAFDIVTILNKQRWSTTLREVEVIHAKNRRNKKRLKHKKKK